MYFNPSLEVPYDSQIFSCCRMNSYNKNVITFYNYNITKILTCESCVPLYETIEIAWRIEIILFLVCIIHLQLLLSDIFEILKLTDVKSSE